MRTLCRSWAAVFALALVSGPGAVVLAQPDEEAGGNGPYFAESAAVSMSDTAWLPGPPYGA